MNWTRGEDNAAEEAAGKSESNSEGKNKSKSGSWKRGEGTSLLDPHSVTQPIMRGV